MSVVPYLRPVLVGPRFENQAIPLEMLRDLAVLEEMVVEVAKWHFLREHEDRKRSPRGFTDGITLALTDVDPGSAIPVISLVLASSLLFHRNQVYYDQAKESIIRAINAAGSNRPPNEHLPDKALAYFDRFGRSLREGESIEFTSDDGKTDAKLTKEVRRKLLLASSEVKELTEEIAVRGAVHEANQETMTFQITLTDSSKVPGPIARQHFESIMDAFAGYKMGVKILIQGVGKFNRLERLQSIESIEHVTILDAQDVAARLQELAVLRDGWLDGDGRAPSEEGLNWLAGAIDMSYPDNLPLPYIYPAPEGGVQLEWPFSPQEPSLEIDFDRKSGEWHALRDDMDADEFESLDLNDEAAWKWVVGRLEEMSGVAHRD
jgi:hypothetical protein